MMDKGREDRDLLNLREQILKSMRSEKSDSRRDSRQKHGKRSKAPVEIFDTDMDDLDSLRAAVVSSMKEKESKHHSSTSSSKRSKPGKTSMRLPDGIPSVHFRSSHPTSPQFPSPPSKYQPKVMLVKSRGAKTVSSSDRHRQPHSSQRERNSKSRQRERTFHRDRRPRERHHPRKAEQHERTGDHGKRVDKWSRLENERKSSDEECSDMEEESKRKDVNLAETESPPNVPKPLRNDSRSGGEDEGREEGGRFKEEETNARSHENGRELKQDMDEQNDADTGEDDDDWKLDQDILAMLDREIEGTAVEFLDQPDSDASPYPPSEEGTEDPSENEASLTGTDLATDRTAESAAEKLRNELAAIDKKLGKRSASPRSTSSSSRSRSSKKKHRTTSPHPPDRYRNDAKSSRDPTRGTHKYSSRIGNTNGSERNGRDRHPCGSIKPASQQRREESRKRPTSLVGSIPGSGGSRGTRVAAGPANDRTSSKQRSRPLLPPPASPGPSEPSEERKPQSPSCGKVPGNPDAPPSSKQEAVQGSKEDLRDFLKQRKPTISEPQADVKTFDTSGSISPRKVVELRTFPIVPQNLDARPGFRNRSPIRAPIENDKAARNSEAPGVATHVSGSRRIILSRNEGRIRGRGKAVRRR